MNLDWKPGKATLLSYALLLVCFAGLVAAKETGLMPSYSVKRWVGVVLAIMLTITGNFLPKLLHPDSHSSAAIRRRRRSSWGLVLTGLALIVTLLIAPDSQVTRWSGVIGVGGLWLVLMDALFHQGLRAMYNKGEGSGNALQKQHAAMHMSALFIIHAIGWVFAMFLADDLWGDAGAKWMVIFFIMSNGMMATFLPLKPVLRAA